MVLGNYSCGFGVIRSSEAHLAPSQALLNEGEGQGSNMEGLHPPERSEREECSRLLMNDADGMMLMEKARQPNVAETMLANYRSLSMDIDDDGKLIDKVAHRSIAELGRDEKANEFAARYDLYDDSAVYDRQNIFIGALSEDGDETHRAVAADELATAEENSFTADGENFHAAQPMIEDVGVSIRTQATNFVEKAGDAFSVLKAKVDAANNMLGRLSKPNQQIPDDLMEDVEDCLTDKPGWLLMVMDGKNSTIDALRQARNELCDENYVLHRQIEDLSSKLESISSKHQGLSAADRKKLQAIGIQSVSELIDRYRVLQVQLDCATRIQPARASVSRVHSQLSVSSSEQCHPMVKPKGGLESLTPLVNAPKVVARAAVHIPMPEKFNGKTRIDLERYFRYFDPAVESRGYSDADKVIILGNYVPTLQFKHDQLVCQGASYAEVKAGLLNALGTNSKVATFTLRTSLDRLKKPEDKLYKNLLEDVERKVNEAYNDDKGQAEAELKKILIRLTQEDANAIFGSTIIPHIDQSYARLKELILGVEAGLDIKLKAEQSLKSSSKLRVAKEQMHPLFHQKRYASNEPHGYRNAKHFGDNQCDEDWDTVQTSKTQAESFSPSSSSVNNHDRMPAVSYKCSKPRHYANDCNESDSHGIRQVKNLDVLEMNGLIPVDTVNHEVSEELQMFGKKALLDVWLDSVKVNAMIDSGACASVISEAAIGRILRRRNKNVRRITQEDPKTFLHKRLVGADGRVLNVVNCITMPVAWGIKPPKFAKFFVVAGLQQDVLIGTNILQEDEHWIEGLRYALQSQSSGSNVFQTQVIEEYDRSIQFGDLVMVKLPADCGMNNARKPVPSWNGPARVLDIRKNHAKVQFLHGNKCKTIHFSQIVKWQGKECGAQFPKGKTSRGTRTLNVINSVDCNARLKSCNTCGYPEEGCSFTVLPFLHNIKCANRMAPTPGKSAEKVMKAKCSKSNEKKKEAAFMKTDDILARPKQDTYSNEVLDRRWKARCPPQAKVFKEMIEKSLDGELGYPDMMLEMVAHLNSVQLMPVNHFSEFNVNHRRIFAERITRLKGKQHDLQGGRTQVNVAYPQSLSTSKNRGPSCIHDASSFRSNFDRGKRTPSSFRNNNPDRGAKLKEEEWMNASSRGSTLFNRRRHTHQ